MLREAAGRGRHFQDRFSIPREVTCHQSRHIARNIPRQITRHTARQITRHITRQTTLQRTRQVTRNTTRQLPGLIFHMALSPLFLQADYIRKTPLIINCLES